MIKFKIDVFDALQRANFNTYKAKTSKLLSQDTLTKLKNNDTNISMKSLNNICLILDMDIKDLVIFEPTEEEKSILKSLK